MSFDPPKSRNEAILQNMLGADNELVPPKGRVEELLMQLLEQGGSGGEPVSPEQIQAAVNAYLEAHPVTAPVESVNGKTGAVDINASDVGAMPDSTVIPSKVSDLTNDSNFQTEPQVQNLVGGKSDKTLRVSMTASNTTPTLDSNKLYVFPEMATLTPTFATPSDNTIANEYHFVFNSGSTATVLTLPATILQPENFTVEANMHYEISVLEGAMTAQGWAVASA